MSWVSQVTNTGCSVLPPDAPPTFSQVIIGANRLGLAGIASILRMAAHRGVRTLDASHDMGPSSGSGEAILEETVAELSTQAAGMGGEHEGALDDDTHSPMRV